MAKKEKKRRRGKYKHLKILRIKEDFSAKKKVFLIIFENFYFNGKNKDSEIKL